MKNQIEKINMGMGIKAVIWVLILFIAFKIYKSVSNLFGNGENIEGIKESIFSPSVEVNLPEDNKGKSTISDHQAAMFADRLYKAFTQWFGTDEKEVFSILHDKLTKNDIIKIYNAFGAKRMYFFTKGDLVLWLKSEFSKSDYQIIEPILKKGGLV